MTTVTEIVDAYPIQDWTLRVERDEKLLFSRPGPPVSKFLTEHPPLQVYHFETEYTPAAFAPPQDVFDSPNLRVEWQKMDGRQPFYHRNLDVDEISFHISGERTLMTELGSVDLKHGDFARIPVYTSHDNHGKTDVHLIFYFTAPMKQQAKTSRIAEPKVPPFEGWKPQQVSELITECLGAVGCDKAIQMVDESLIMQRRFDTGIDQIKVVNACDCTEPGNDTTWVYTSELVWLGSTTVCPNAQRVYRRHRRADEIQYQVKGSRTLITQRGIVKLEPGDFINIPMGVAFSSVAHDEESMHLSVLTRYPTDPKAKVARVAEETKWEVVEKLN